VDSATAGPRTAIPPWASTCQVTRSPLGARGRVDAPLVYGRTGGHLAGIDPQIPPADVDPVEERPRMARTVSEFSGRPVTATKSMSLTPCR
jgi:hypothetical protein